MSSEEPRVAQAYVDIQARKGDRFREQVRTIGEEFGHEAGDGAGKEFEREFDRQVESPSSRSRHRQQGRHAGDLIGAAAGAAAGPLVPAGITEGLRKAAPALVNEGEALGQVLGAAAGRRARTLTRAEISAELKAAQKAADLAAKAAARQDAQLARAAAAETKAAERAAAQAARAAAKEADAAARAAAAAVKQAEREAAQAETAFKARMDRLEKRANLAAKVISRPLIGGSGLVGRLTSISAVGAGAAGLSGLGSVTAGTVSAVTALSGLVGPLGAGLAGAGVGAGTLAIGLHGVSDAIKDSGDLKKFNEDIKSLSPNAQAFAREVRGMRGELGKLRNNVQDALFKGIAKDVGDLSDRYLPILDTGLTRVSKAFNSAARDAAGFLDTKGAGNQVSGILDNISGAADQLAPALKPATRALLDFIDAGSEELPGLADDITHISDRFSDFIHRSKESGDLHDFFQGGIDAGKDLIDVTKNVGRTLGGIFSAGATGDSSGLKTLADLTDRIADQVNKPEFQSGLRDLFGALKDAGAQVGDSLPAVADALVALEPAAAKFLRGSGTALANILEETSQTAEDLAPFLNAVASAFEDIAPHASVLLGLFLGIKGGLLGLKVADNILTGYETLAGRFDRVATAAETASGKVGGFRGALGGIAAAATVVTVAELADAIGEASGNANVAAVNVRDLASALGDLGKGGEIGKAGLKVLGTGGLFGLIKNPADDSTDALKKFGTAAYNALDQGWDARLGRWQSFGQAQSAFKKQTTQLDKAFADLASKGQIDTAATSFEKFLKAGKDAGVPVASLKAQFPEFTARLKDAGLQVDNTTGKVTNLDGALRSLPSSKQVKIQGVGFVQAITSAELLRERLQNIPKNVIARVQTQYIDVFASEVARDNARSRGHGPFTGGRIGADGSVSRYQAGGLVDWRLGGPRQDNVPILVSGREFVVNAFATEQPGVLAWLQQLNTTNRLPGYANGGSVAGAAGLNDVSQTLNRRVITTHDDTPASGAGGRMHPDDLAALAQIVVAGVDRGTRNLRVELSTGELAGAVFRQGGATW